MSVDILSLIDLLNKADSFSYVSLIMLNFLGATTVCVKLFSSLMACF